MRPHAAVAALALTLVSAQALIAGTRDDARKQVEFGIQVAGRGLWREAIFRWKRATEIDPAYAEAFNNLGIAYEHEGDLPKAREAYEKAVSLAPNNASIRQNFELFKEVNDRASGSSSK